MKIRRHISLRTHTVTGVTCPDIPEHGRRNSPRKVSRDNQSCFLIFGILKSLQLTLVRLACIHRLPAGLVGCSVAWSNVWSFMYLSTWQVHRQTLLLGYPLTGQRWRRLIVPCRPAHHCSTEASWRASLAASIPVPRWPPVDYHTWGQQEPDNEW